MSSMLLLAMKFLFVASSRLAIHFPFVPLFRFPDVRLVVLQVPHVYHGCPRSCAGSGALVAYPASRERVPLHTVPYSQASGVHSAIVRGPALLSGHDPFHRVRTPHAETCTSYNG